MKKPFYLYALALVAACGAPPAANESTQEIVRLPSPVGESAGIDGNDRLERTVVPRAYRLDLSINPDKDRFSGVVEVVVDISAPTGEVRLHAEEIDIREAEARLGEKSGERPIAGRVVRGENGGIAVRFERALPAGRSRLRFAYDAPLDEVPTGLYRVNDGGRWYAFTQFEPLEARQAFPCFDEPRFKTPYTTIIRVPAGMTAVSNTPAFKVTREAGLDVFQFTVSKPYPTYLVALAVGQFDVLEAPADAIDGVRFRLLAPTGKGRLGETMLARTPELLASLTRYLGSAYPYQKLDVIAVPNFSAGAMENVGLITFRESRLLMDPGTASVGDRRGTASIMAHELAHMWFGNLVTMPWWDELWLNEAFATWMAHRVMVEVLPELQSDIDAVRGTSWVMGIDAATEARAIRQPIEHGGDVYNAFDWITYVKGAAVLRMFEAWLGEEVFRSGIRSYLEANAHGVGTTADLMAALEAASGKSVGETMKLFLDQPGTPFLDITPTCEKENVTLSIRQSRYLPAGSSAEQGDPWTIPICVRYQKDARSIEESMIHCSLVEGREDSIRLPTDRCPAFIYPNANQAGYFRWNLPADRLRDLTDKYRDALTAAEKVGLLYNVGALLEARKIAPDTYFAVIDGMSREKHRAVIEWLMGSLHGLREMIPDGDRPAFRKWTHRLLDDDLERVGTEKRSAEGADPAMLRPRLLKALALLAADKRVLAHLRRVTENFLNEMSSVDSDAAAVALTATAWDGDQALWHRYRKALGGAPTPAAREALIAGLGSFRDPELLRKSLEFGLDGTIRSQDFYSLIRPSRDDPSARRVSWEWFEKNYERIVRMLGSKRVPGLPRVGAGFCDPEGRKKVEVFFSDPAHIKEGTARNLANTLESIDRCIRLRAYMRDALSRYLNRR